MIVITIVLFTAFVILAAVLFFTLSNPISRNEQLIGNLLSRLTELENGFDNWAKKTLKTVDIDVKEELEGLARQSQLVVNDKITEFVSKITDDKKGVSDVIVTPDSIRISMNFCNYNLAYSVDRQAWQLESEAIANTIYNFVKGMTPKTYVTVNNISKESK